MLEKSRGFSNFFHFFLTFLVPAINKEKTIFPLVFPSFAQA